MALRSTSLGDLERTVMDTLWTHGPDLSVRDVMDHLPDRADKELAYTTVMTVLDRLAKKDLADRALLNRAWQYTPRSSQAEVIARDMGRLLDGVPADVRDEALRLLNATLDA